MDHFTAIGNTEAVEFLKEDISIENDVNAGSSPRMADALNTAYKSKKARSKPINNTRRKNAISILELVKQNKEKKVKTYLPAKQTLKCITLIYNEKLKEFRLRQAKNDQLFIEYIYDFYIKSFGFISIAEPKLIAFLISLKNYAKKSRVCLFGKFLGLDANEDYNTEELNKYIEGLDFLATSNMGHSITNNEMESEHLCTYIRGLEFLKKFCEEMNISPSDTMELRKEMDKLRQDHSVGNIRMQVVNVDSFLEIVVRKYRQIIGNTKQFVLNAFRACDLDMNGYCSEDEFLLLWKHLNGDTFDRDRATKKFLDRADKESEGEMLMSFDRFCVVAAELGLFSEDRQLKFLQLSSKSKLLSAYRSLRSKWPAYREEIHRRILTLPEEAKVLDWESVLEQIGERMWKCSEREVPGLLISCRMLEYEVFASFKEVAGADQGVEPAVPTQLDISAEPSEIRPNVDAESLRSRFLRRDQSNTSFLNTEH